MSDQIINLTQKRVEAATENGDVNAGSEFRPIVRFENDMSKDFYLGLCAGRIMNILRHTKPETFTPIAVNSKNVEFYKMIAPQLGYDLEVTISPDPDWAWPVFTRRKISAVDS